MSTRRLTLAIYGLEAAGEGGARAIARALARQPGVVRAYVNPATEMAYVKYLPTRASLEQLVAAVEGAGFRTGEPMAR